MAASFISSAGILAKNPQGTMVTVAYAAFSAILNMACLVAIGYAFGFEHVTALVAAFAVAAISVILSPTPQGVGVVEAAIAAILTAHGCSLATATAIALVYRGIMFWMPFCIGAVLLSQSGFFADKRDPSQEKRAKDTAWISGTLVLVVGLVNIGMALIPRTFEPFTMLTEWVDMGGLLIGPALLWGSVLLIVLAVGLILRLRTAWALTLCALVLLAGGEFLYVNTVQVAVAAVVLVGWLFWRRDAFDRPIVPREDASRLVREFRENVERFRAWRAARGKSGGDAAGAIPGEPVGEAASPSRRFGPKSRVGKASVVQPAGHESAAARVRRTTGWERRAEKGAEIRRAAQGDAILGFADDAQLASVGVEAWTGAPDSADASTKEDPNNGSAR